MDNPQLSWMSYVIRSPQIKVENSDLNNSLISPPSPPFPTPLSVTSSSTSRRRGSTSSLAGPKRPRPYPSVAPNYSNSPNRRAKSDTVMSTNEFGTWSTMRSGSGRASVGRRSSDEEEQTPYSMPPYMNDYLTMSDGHSATEVTPPSSSSSLSGAMGGDGSRGSRSPPSNTSVYGGHGSMSTQDLAWNNQQMSASVGIVALNNNAYPGVAGGFSPSVNNLYDYTTRQTSPSDSISSQTPQGYPQVYDQYGLSRSAMGVSHRSNGYNSSALSAPFPPPAELSMAPVDSSSADTEIRRLRRRVRELEMENSRARTALESLRSSVPNSASLSTPPHSSGFQAGWRARTEARKKLFCSLNRAGNALCSWHDSRRERRAYPPRNAPAGYLNCGCTYDQALFEESLSRHGVGSYHPGETVRMDPALRNPLLKLLEQRYGYKDGDFEHDSLTEEWHEDESPALWEQKVLSGQAVRRRPDNHTPDRR